MYQMRNYLNFYINGEWIAPSGVPSLDVIDPNTEEVAGVISLGNHTHVDQAVAAAKHAFAEWSLTTPAQRVAILERVCEVYGARMQDIAEAINEEMGAPLTSLAIEAQAPMGLGHFMTTTEILKNYAFEEKKGTTTILREPAGVVAMITPWNWPMNQMACKVAPALAAGCTMVLKPSEVAPFSAYLLAEILHEAGVPPGVFNLVNGDGPGVGSYLTAHPDIDLVSFTGSSRAGKMIVKAAADTLKNVSLELGGKSANIILEDADMQEAITNSVATMMMNTGQSCNAPSRMLVPKSSLAKAEDIARKACEGIVVGDSRAANTTMGPLASKMQFEKVQGLIGTGIDEGAKLVCGGPGLPDGIGKGYFTRATVFSDVNNQMTIAREEIFGPVLCIIPYENEEEAIAIANDTPYGLSGYVFSGDHDRASRVARRLRTGAVHLNGAPVDLEAPFGGYKQSGMGREWGVHGFEEFLEVKAVMGDNAA
tara:strand:+ start:29156 stop:30598 length:1443 start_codon:yes stop_codon:yes gene_type:complete